MVTLIAVDTLLVALLAVLVVGLLRSHGEILRRLGAAAEGSLDLRAAPADPLADGRPRMRAGIQDPRSVVTPAFDISGNSLSQDTVNISMTTGVDTLIAFLSSGCLTCQTLWHGLSPDSWTPLPNDARVVVVTKDSSFESPSKLRELSPPGIHLVMSSQAWSDYNIEGSPYFVYVSGDGAGVLSEGSASSWQQVRSLLRDALADYEWAKAQAMAEQGQEIAT